MTTLYRPSWQETWFSIAETFSKRATCPRLQTAALLVSPENRLISAGYNGAPSGHPHCIDAGCILYEGHCVRSLHGERNALNNAALLGASTKGSKAYILHFPCVNCTNALVAAGIVAIECKLPYKSYADDPAQDIVFNILTRSGIEMEFFRP